jgi:hypothetical protein
MIMTMIGKLLCRLGLHKWRHTSWKIGRYKHFLRICQRDHCKRVEKAEYNMLDFDWVKVELFTDEVV